MKHWPDKGIAVCSFPVVSDGTEASGTITAGRRDPTDDAPSVTGGIE